MSVSPSLDGPRVLPAGGRAPRQLVVLLHGYGADGNDLIGLAPRWQPLLPEAAFVAPNAPSRMPGSQYGYQWFSLDRYDPNLLRRDPAQAAALYATMHQAAVAVAGQLNRYLDAELARYGLPEDRLALVGFSQGTMMALYVGLRRPQPCAGIVGYSGALLGGERLAEEVRCRPPVLLLHGDADEIVPVPAMFAAVQGLGLAEVPVEWHVRPGLEHGIDPEGLELGGRFLADRLLSGR